MASRWIDVVLSQSEPIDLGLDGSARMRYAVNVLVTREDSATFDAEIESVLVAAGIAATQIFKSSKAQFPTGAGPYLGITLSGGPPGIRIHNLTSKPKYRRSTAQLLAVGQSKPATLALAEQAGAALAAVKDQIVS